MPTIKAADGAPEPDRTGGRILTYTGLIIYPLDPRPEEISLFDIAHATANLCRFTGHSESFYSVAEHSCRVAMALGDDDPDLALTGLMHDATEAYLGDMSGPLKHNSYVGKLLKSAENRLGKVIAEKFDLIFPFPDRIKELDIILARTEQRDLMPYPNNFYSLDGEEMLEATINPWSPEEAEIEFLDLYKELTNDRVRV